MVNSTSTPNGIDMKGLYETWEKAATAYFDAFSKSPAFLGAMGKTIEAQLGMKSHYDKLMQNTLEAWRVPTARDMESLGDRVACLEERLAAIEEAVGTTASSCSEKK